MAAEPSSETSPVTISLNGSVTARTPSRSSIEAIVSSIAEEYGSSSTSSPSSATTTIWALVPLACGNERFELLDAGLRLGARDRERVVGALHEDRGAAAGDAEEQQPRDEHAPRVTVRPAAECVQKGGQQRLRGPESEVFFRIDTALYRIHECIVERAGRLNLSSPCEDGLENGP